MRTPRSPEQYPPPTPQPYYMINPGYTYPVHLFDHAYHRQPDAEKTIESLRQDIRELKRSQDMLVKTQLDALQAAARHEAPASPLLVEKGSDAAAETLAKCMEAFLERDRSLARERDELNHERQRLALDLERRTHEMLLAAKSAANTVGSSSSAAALEAERARRLHLDIERERRREEEEAARRRQMAEAHNEEKRRREREKDMQRQREMEAAEMLRQQQERAAQMQARARSQAQAQARAQAQAKAGEQARAAEIAARRRREQHQLDSVGALISHANSPGNGGPGNNPYATTYSDSFLGWHRGRRTSLVSARQENRPRSMLIVDGSGEYHAVRLLPPSGGSTKPTVSEEPPRIQALSAIAAFRGSDTALAASLCATCSAFVVFSPPGVECELSRRSLFSCVLDAPGSFEICVSASGATKATMLYLVFSRRE